MNEEILKLITTYKLREARLTERIAELKRGNIPRKDEEVKLAQNARVFWSVVIKDLENLVRKQL